MEHLWRSRGIDLATAERFGVGIVDYHGRRWWSFPVVDARGQYLATKLHRSDLYSEKKSKWFWPAVERIDRAQLYPINLGPPGPVWLCPGELKALAVAALGRASIGITSGEGTATTPANLSTHALELLRGREVAIVGDDDTTGAAWAKHVQEQLSDAGIDARIVDLALNNTAGLKDIGDFIVRALHEDATLPETIAANLDEAYRRSDPWFGTRLGDLMESTSIWKPCTLIPTGLADLDRSLGGGLRTRGVHVLASKTGQAKTQLAVAMVLGAARRGTSAAYLSLELGADEVGQLIAASTGDIPRSALAAGAVSSEYGERLRRAINDTKAWPLWILDDTRWPGGLDRDSLARLIRSGVERFGWRVVFLDYLGLLCPVAGEADQFTTDLRNSSMLRSLVRKLDIALIIVASVRKGGDFKSPDKLTIDDIAGAGRIVYDATSVIVVSRNIGDDRSGIVTTRILKNRFSRCDESTEAVHMRWYPHTGRIVDMPVDQPVGNRWGREENGKTEGVSHGRDASTSDGSGNGRCAG